MAIPTEYRGIRFRSRLEARWATFFDSLRWPWMYEPLDLAGYLPDFVLQFEEPLLVEIKPALSLPDMRPAEDKIDRSGWVKEAMVVGAEIWELARAFPLLGRLGEVTDVPGEAHEWDSARLFWCCQCERPSVLCEERSWHCRVCGADSSERARHWASFPRELIGAWFEAANGVQWRSS